MYDMPVYVQGSSVDITGLVYIYFPASLRTLVALRYRGHLLCRIFVLPPYRLPRRAEHQHTSMSKVTGKGCADQSSGTISKRKMLDQHPPTHRAPRYARAAFSTRSDLAEYNHRNLATLIAGPRMRQAGKSCRLTARIYTSSRIMATYTACYLERICCLKHPQRKS